MAFMDQMKNFLDNEMNVSRTENGALGYRTSGKFLLDLNFAVSSLRNVPDEDICERFVKAFYEDRRLAVKWIMYAADVREGLGERRLLRVLMRYLSDNHTEIARALLPLLPEYTRWDNVVELLASPVGDDAAELILQQLRKDVSAMEKRESISLCAKWLPSANGSSKERAELAHLLMKKLSMTNRQYRKLLSALRKYLRLVEIYMSSREWDKIDYEAVPSRANLLYNKAFFKNDENRRKEYLESLKKGEKKINASVLYPHDIVNSYYDDLYANPYSRCQKLKEYDTTLEELWKALPDYVQGAGDILCVADGSGSMLSSVGGTKLRALHIANALAIYFSEHCTGQFGNCYITFSQKPQIVDLERGKSLREKLEIAMTHNEVANTDIEAVFDLILKIAIKNAMRQEDLPGNILILSDMEFDVGCGRREGYKNIAPDERLFDGLRQRYAARGYRLPRLIFWNICSRTNTIPLRSNDLGVVLVSGFSPTIARMVLGGRLDPYEALIEQLDSPRYSRVEKAIMPYI